LTSLLVELAPLGLPVAVASSVDRQGYQPRPLFTFRRYAPPESTSAEHVRCISSQSYDPSSASSTSSSFDAATSSSRAHRYDTPRAMTYTNAEEVWTCWRGQAVASAHHIPHVHRIVLGASLQRRSGNITKDPSSSQHRFDAPHAIPTSNVPTYDSPLGRKQGQPSASSSKSHTYGIPTRLPGISSLGFSGQPHDP